MYIHLTIMSSRNYCFTIFENSIDALSDVEEVKNDSIADRQNDNKVSSFSWDLDPKRTIKTKSLKVGIQYCIYQREKNILTGNEHYQGYIELTSNLTKKQIQQLLNAPRAHVEPRKGTQDANIAYCSKEESRLLPTVIFGTPAKQGLRSDLKKMKKDILQNITSETIISDFALANRNLYVKFHNGIDKLILLSAKERDFKTEVLVYWGESGTGKTRKVYDDAKASGNKVYKKPNGSWWDGYQGQHTVLIDDYDGYVAFREFLQLCDRYPHQVPIKGSFRNFSSKRIIITSNINPQKWYQGLDPFSYRAFQRRIDKVIKFVGTDDEGIDEIEDKSFYDSDGCQLSEISIEEPIEYGKLSDIDSHENEVILPKFELRLDNLDANPSLDQLIDVYKDNTIMSKILASVKNIPLVKKNS